MSELDNDEIVDLPGEELNRSSKLTRVTIDKAAHALRVVSFPKPLGNSI